MSVTRKLADKLLELSGWTIETPAPQVDRYVAIAAPHTSNWDGYHMIVVGWALNLPLRWLGKHTLFKGPGRVFKHLGGIPVERSRHHGLVHQVAESIKSHDRIAIVVPPEGTRSRVDTWKSGFYRIAMEAGVPIVPAYLDYARKAVGFGDPIMPTGDLAADMDRIRAFYADKIGRHPDRFAEPRLRNE